MSLCDKLFVAKKDEEGGVTEYGSLKSEITPENQEQTDTIERIINDEQMHLKKVNEMIKHFGCPEIKSKTKRRK